MNRETVNHAKLVYRDTRIKSLEKQNVELISSLVDTQKTNKMLWLALIIMSGLSFIQSLVLFNG